MILFSVMLYGTVGECTKALDQNQVRIKFRLVKLCSPIWFSKLLILNYHEKTCKKKRHKDIRAAELSNGKSSQTCCLHTLYSLEMGCCNCLVIRPNCVYLNLQWFSPFTEVWRKLLLWAIAGKRTENWINHPTKINYWGNNYFWLVFHIWLWFVVFFSVNTEDCKPSHWPQVWFQHWKQSCSSPMRSRQTARRKRQITQRGEKKHEKIRKHFHYSFPFLIDVSSNCLGQAFCSSHLRNC